MTTIMDLPIEVIYTILQQKIIDIKDVINFNLTCRRFNKLDNNLLWQTKLYQSFDIRRPHLKKIYDNRIQNKESINFKDEIKTNINLERNLGKALFSYLSLLSEKLIIPKPLGINRPSDIDIEKFDILFRPNIGARTMNYHFLKDELLYQIKMSPLDPECNLTHQFYSKILLPYLQRRHLEDIWLEFINYPKEQQLLENAATILAQWYQSEKCIYNFDIKASLDDIAQQTLNSLKKAHWDHPIFSMSAKWFSFWKYNNIDDNHLSKIEEKQIIDVLLTVLFDELGFHLHSDWIDDIFIDCVLESKIGNPIILAIIFQSVARRLGVRCDLVRSDLGCLCWKPKSIAENLEDEECFYIDILHGGTIRGRNECPIESYNKHEKISPTEMVLFMHSELETNTFIDKECGPLNVAREEYVYVESDSLNIDTEYYCEYYDIMYMKDYLRLCQTSLQEIQNNYNNRKSVESSRRIEDILRRYTFEMSVQCKNAYLQIPRIGNPFHIHMEPKNRTRNIKYAVGMIVTCRIESSPSQTGVIIGWDENFDYRVNMQYNCTIVCSRSLALQLPQGSGITIDRGIRIFDDSQICDTAAQPFYIILSENGHMYYACQNALIETKPRWIKHREIGRYFCKFTNVYYVPNEVLTRYYPQDQAILNTLLLGQFHLS